MRGELRGGGTARPGRAALCLLLGVTLMFTGAVGSADARKLSRTDRAKARAQLRKQVKRNPRVLRRKAFLRRAALVNFKLPVTIRLRNPCTEEAGQNPYPTTGGSPSQLALGQNCLTQGTALNQLTVPTASVNLGPSLGTREVALAGGLAAVVEFQDTYDGGALGNVNIKLLPGNKRLSSSSVPLLWNSDISGPGGRSDADVARSLARPGGMLPSLESWAGAQRQGCRDWMQTNGGGLTPGGYNALLYGSPADLGFGASAGAPGFPVYTSGGAASGAFLPIAPGVDNPAMIQAGGVVGGNDWIGPNPNPFPTGSRPGVMSSNAADTVLRTNALSLGIAPGGVAVNMSTGTATSAGGLPTAQGSQDVTLGYSGGQANLFGNIPGKNVGIDVTVNLETRINAIARVMDQDVFKQPALVEGENYPAAYFNCRQVLTGAVQNYIPGVRLTGSLRIAPAITKDGRVRIAKATVRSDVNNPDRVALSACLFPAKPFNRYTSTGTGASTDGAAAPIPTLGDVNGGGSTLSFSPTGPFFPPASSLALVDNTAMPFVDAERYPNGVEGNAPSQVPCGSDDPAHLADVIRKAGLTKTVSGLPTPSDPAYAGVAYRGDQASVAGDITVNPIDVDVVLGDVSTDVPAPAVGVGPPETYITSAPSGTDSSTSASVSFMSPSTGATFECRLDGGAWTVCVSPESLTGLANGSHTYEVRAKNTSAVYDPTPASATWIVNTSYTGPTTYSGSSPPGNTTTNDPDGGPPSATVPTASVSTPGGGSVSITDNGAGPPPPSGYSFLGQTLNITAPAATAANPLSITLSLDVSGNPLILTASDVVIFRNGVPVPDCSPNNGQANPDPCVSVRTLSGGIATVTVLTSAASAWNVGVNSGVTTASATGVVYEDVNNNGTQDSGEPGINGRIVYADVDGTPGFNPATDPSTTTQTIGGVAGKYTLTGTPPASPLPATLRTVLPSGWRCSDPARGPTCGYSGSIVPGLWATGADFGTYDIPDSMVALGDSLTQAYNSPPCVNTNCPQNSWSTGTAPSVNSHYQRIQAVNPGMTVADNRAQTGVAMAGLLGQVNAAVASPTDYEYVTIEMGGEDVCIGNAPGDVLTDPTAFQTQFDTAMTALFNGLPQTRVFVSSIADLTRLYDSLSGNPAAVDSWAARGTCRNILGNASTSTTTSRAAARTATIAYNQALRAVCAAHAPRCIYDDDWLFNETGPTDEISTVDYLHLTVAGQEHLAQNYTRGFNWSSETTSSVSGRVYEDVDNSGHPDLDEPGISGRTVYVDRNGNNAYDPGSESATSATTSSTGYWQLTVPAGVTGAIRAVLPAADSRCSQPSTTLAGCEYTVGLQSGASYPNRDFGTYTLPDSMAGLGDSLTRAFIAEWAFTPPSTYTQPAGRCTPFGGFWDCPEDSWSTGDNASPTFTSHYKRLVAAGSAITRAQTFNFAVSGSPMSALNGQAAQAVTQGVDYVTIAMGGNDACGTNTNGVMTDVTAFGASFDAAMTTLMNASPRPRVFVMSISDLYAFWNLLHTNPTAVSTWNSFGICKSMFTNPTSLAPADEAQRQAARQRIRDYNAELQRGCARYAPYCKYDGGAVFNAGATYTTADLGLISIDYFHPTVAGESEFASLTYPAGFNW